MREEMEYPVKQKQVVYEAETKVVEYIKICRERLYKICHQCIDRLVRIQTMDGIVYEGMIVKVDKKHVYLSISQGYPDGYMERGFFYGPGAYYSNVILPLALFDLLTITLLI
jgi:hypothetical protein